jgi:hypothetical protein
VEAVTVTGPSPVGAVVLGVSRSGTSLATGSLVAAGFCVGREQDLMPANSSNPAGYWENTAVWRANEELLAAAGGTWFSPPSREAQSSIRTQASDRLQDLLGRLREHAGQRPLVIKDPRVCALLDLWNPLIDRLLHPVLPIRDPLEIALSLAARDGTPAAFAHASWEVQTLTLLEYLHGRAVTVVRYEDLLAAPEAAAEFVAAAAQRLDPGLLARIDPTAAAGMARRELRHNDARLLDAGDHLTRSQLELWRFLDGLHAGDHVLNVPEKLRQPSRAALALTRQECERLRSEELRLHMTAELQELRVHRRDLDELAQDFRERAELAEQRLAAVTNSKSWRITASLRAIGRTTRRGGQVRPVPLPGPQTDQ